MITLSNGHNFEYMVASGALAYDGYGWWWERPLVWLGLIRPQLFTVVTKTLTRNPREGNLKMWKPWDCVRLMKGGSVINKVGLTNPGIDWWIKKVGPKVNGKKVPLIVSIYGTRSELVEMTQILADVDVVGIEVNASCPNTGHPMEDVQSVIDDVKAVRRVDRHFKKHPIIIKLSVAQDYVAIAQGLIGVVEAIALNSVPFEMVYPKKGTDTIRSPLWRLEAKVGGGGGGVSGKLAQQYNWQAVRHLSQEVLSLPVIGPSIMEYEDMATVRSYGAQAVSFGSIHIRKPWKPTSMVIRDWTENTRPNFTDEE